MLAADASIMSWVILLAAVVPVPLVLVGAWFFLRAGRRWDEQQRSR